MSRVPFLSNANRRLRLIFGGLLAAILLTTNAFAQTNQCHCDSTATWDAAFEKANIIFLGTCMDITPNTIKGGLNVVFQVDSSWKRATEHVTTVHTNSPNQCGYPFKRNARYIVFANKRHQTVETSECEPNQAYEDNGILTLRRLGAGFTPGREDKANGMILLMLALGVSGLLFLGFVVLRKKFRKPKAVN
ncbi:MAG: hypothetical protein IPP17_29210 [Bacteroidetes bacterium]|nr:hypothetical protein [Bacteroidota bacterium]